MGRHYFQVVRYPGQPQTSIYGTPTQIAAGQLDLAHLHRLGHSFREIGARLGTRFGGRIETSGEGEGVEDGEQDKVTILSRQDLTSSLDSSLDLDEEGGNNNDDTQILEQELIAEVRDLQQHQLDSQSPPSVDEHRSPTPSHSSDTTISPLFVFNDQKQYTLARTLFTTKTEPNHAAKMKWGTFIDLLRSKPLSCFVEPNGTKNGWKVVWQPPDSAKPAMEANLHQIHGKNGWLMRNMLRDISRQLCNNFGWECEDFVLAVNKA